MEGENAFGSTALEFLRELLAAEPVGNRWFKVNLHVHAEGNDPCEIVAATRNAGIDLIAITDHQTFRFFRAVADAAAAPGRPLTVLPGIEITSVEGVHVLGIFPEDFGEKDQQQLLGWLEITGSGATREASKRTLDSILSEVHQKGGVMVVPHPKTQGIGMLDSARKLNIKVGWLESGHVRLMQTSEDVVRYVARDDEENFVNRFVLASSRPEDIAGSRYCLAPFNRSDAQRPADIADGCSWFRMREASVAGLKQVGCEPRTRIARSEPAARNHDWIMAVRVSGGYCDGETFRFSDGLNCVVGPNHAGKSSVFDFLRFGLGGEDLLPHESRQRLLDRLNGILGAEGVIEVFLRQCGEYYVVQRTFTPRVTVKRGETTIEGCEEAPRAYQLVPEEHGLVPVEDFSFPLEIYEQGRIGRLRDDLERQLEMLDEFAGLGELKRQREEVIADLVSSSELLKPLYEERETLRSQLANLGELRKELAAKEKMIPDEEEEQRWAKADEGVDSIEETIGGLQSAVAEIPEGPVERTEKELEGLELLFGQDAPAVDPEEVAEAPLLLQWAEKVRAAVDAVAESGGQIRTAVATLDKESRTLRKTWETARKRRQDHVRVELAKVQVASPAELVKRVKELRRQVNTLEKISKPRLGVADAEITKGETAHERLLVRLQAADQELSKRREEKAKELTLSLEGQIKVEVVVAGSKDEYEELLNDLCEQITTQEHRISKRQGQIGKIVETMGPIELARALRAKGMVRQPDGSMVSLQSACGVTENTQNVLCRIADDIRLLTKLQTVGVPDVPRILVRRRGEGEYANIRTGLSPGEQSAAILTMALQTRRLPLIIDQPEDELGYSYVVHLVVPKVLEVKSSRQLIIISHNANIPVLGDADYVLRLENVPQEGGGRCCTVECEGCFESAKVTSVLLELDGGRRAFEFRQYRYALPK